MPTRRGYVRHPAGRWSITADSTSPVALHATGGALLCVMRAVLDGQLGDQAGEQHAERVLRMLGVPREEAAEIARRPLPLPLPSEDQPVRPV